MQGVDAVEELPAPGGDLPFELGEGVAGLREALDVAPFSKVLFSSDAWGAPERVLVGAAGWRDAATRVLTEYVDVHGWPASEAVRVAELMAWRNAEAVYGRRFVDR